MNRSVLAALGVAVILVIGGVLYSVTTRSANTPNAASTIDTAALVALRSGNMMKLNFHTTPKPVSDVPFTDSDGAEHRLGEFHGKVVLVNFWATWCAPCRVEMPTLDALAGAFASDDFKVVAIATGRNPPPAIRKFFDEINVEHLGVYLDPRQNLARDMAVLGLPITVILDRDGQEIARLRGDADWASDSAKAIIAALVAKG